MTYKVIANPTAGRGLARTNLPKLEAELKKLGISYKLFLTEGPKDAWRLAEDVESYEGIIAVGGDGTINEVVNGMPEDKPLCIVPLGTGNDLARSLKIPLGIKSLITIKEGNLKLLDLGIENDGRFVSSVALGLASDVMIKVNSNRNNPFLKGPFAIYMAIVASAFSLKPLQLRIEADDNIREIESILTYVMNTPYTGGGLFLAPEADPTDGLLDVVIVRDTKGLELLRILPKAYSGKHVNHPHVEFLKARNVKITSTSAHKKMVDGEIRGDTPLVAHINDRKLQIFVP